MAQVNLNINELKSFLNHIINNNRVIQEKGKNPVAVEVVGDSGIGKTSTIIQIAQEHNLDFVKLNLAQIEELGDLVGFPVKQFQVAKKINTEEALAFNATTARSISQLESLATTSSGQNYQVAWIDEMAVQEYIKANYVMTGKKRMSYAAPEWIADKKKGGILLLDDWNRADVRFIQAIMELIDRQSYISWSLPKDWHIVLTSNPDNGDYMVNSIDSAQKTRFITANLKYDIDVWAKWAEEAEIDTRCINFLLMHPELVTQETNARSITTFFNSISSIDNFEDSLPLIQMIGEGSVGQEFASLFTMFINNRLDKMMSPKDILLTADDDKVISSLKNSISKDSDYRADIAATQATRIANYSLYYAKDNRIDDKIISRLSKLIVHEMFTDDLKYLMVREVVNGNKTKFQKLLMNPTVLKYTAK
jgi:hypothetical protein